MSGPYCRVYWSIRHDERFRGVYADDAALASWLRLLISAEGVYPAPADVPAWLKPDVLALLIERGLIELVDDLHYRVHGLEAERERRSAAARTGAAARWSQSERNADRIATASGLALLAEQSKAETSKDEQGAADGGDDPLATYHSLFGRPGANALKWLNDLAERFGDAATSKAIAQAVKDGTERNRVLGVAESYLTAQKRRAMQAAKPHRMSPLQREIAAAIDANYDKEATA